MAKEKEKKAAVVGLQFDTDWQYAPSPESRDHIQIKDQYELFIGGKWVKPESGKYFDTINPATEEKIARVAEANKADVDKAVKAARLAYDKYWRTMSPKDRGKYIFRIARMIQEKAREFAIIESMDGGKAIRESRDVDVPLAANHFFYYAGWADKLEYAFPNRRPEPLGVAGQIIPWNFPLLMAAWKLAPALATGNTVVLKPSSESPMMGWLFADIMREIGLPKGVLNFLVSSGAEAGDYLVQHASTRFISFTGSMEVGLRVNELAARTSPGQIWIKRVVAEMGGKDAIIVDAETDIDEAVKGTVAAAFGFQGQKCSACSRVIVDKSVYKEFVEKVAVATLELQQGDPKANYPVGPVVSERAMKTILKYIGIGAKEGRLVVGGKRVAGLDGYYIEPTVIADVKPNDVIAQEEIFGPVLAIIKSNNFDHAMAIANGTKYGLTGAVYTKNPKKLEQARRDFFVGNLYLNRKCTGALVGVHPFGGFNMSGTDSKAGGRDYLLLFLQAKSIAQKA